MSRSVVDEVFARAQPKTVATGMWGGFNPDMFAHLRVPEGQAPDGDGIAVKIPATGGVGGIELTPGRYRLTNELAKFLAHSSLGVWSYSIGAERDDIWLELKTVRYAGPNHGSDSDDSEGGYPSEDGVVYR